MAIYNESLDISIVKLIVVGERGTGKTSLIRTMKEGHFSQKWDPWKEDLVRKVLYWPEEKISLQMGELQLEAGVAVPQWAADPKAILLVYDWDDRLTMHAVRNKWYSLVNRYFAHVPLFLVRTKADEVCKESAELGEKLRQELHAVGFFECSAKMNRGVEEAFEEIVKYYKLQQKKKAICCDNDPVNAPSSLGCFVGMLYNSGPLLKQAFSNMREVVKNPQAFPEQKRNIQSYVPILNFGLPKEDSKKKQKDEKGEIEDHEREND